MNERIAVGRRSARRTLLSRTPVRLSVSAIEKNAIAAVISSRGSAKRRTWPIKPGRCHAGGIGSTVVPPLIRPKPSTCPDRFEPESYPAGRPGPLVPGRETPATRGLDAIRRREPCRPCNRPCARQRSLRLRASATRPARPPKVSPTGHMLESSECVRGPSWLHHLSSTTFQQARKFRASPADAGLYRPLGDPQHLGNLLVVHIL